MGGAVAAQLTGAMLGSNHPALRVILEPARHLAVGGLWVVLCLLVNQMVLTIGVNTGCL